MTTQEQINELHQKIDSLAAMLPDLPLQTAALIVAIRDGRSLEDIAGYRDEALIDLRQLGKREGVDHVTS